MKLQPYEHAEHVAKHEGKQLIKHVPQHEGKHFFKQLLRPLPMHRVAQPPMMRVLIFVSFGRRQIMLLHLVMKLNR